MPPYHPSSNGLDENMVKTVKQAFNKASKGDSVEAKLSKFLTSYQNTPHSVTGCTPAEILLGRVPRTRLSLVHPCMAQRVSVAMEERVGSHSRRTFVDSQAVYLRDLRPSATSRWVPAHVVRKLGPLAYVVDTNGHCRQAHVDHLKPCPETQPDTDTPLERGTSTSAGEEHNPAQTPLVILDDSSTTTEQPDGEVSSTPEPVVRPQRNWQPPRWSIEEMAQLNRLFIPCIHKC